MKQFLTREKLFYMALWTLLFIVPVLMQYLQTTHGEVFDWKGLLIIWKQLAVYLGIFIFHHVVLAPMLIERRKLWLYLASVATLVALFFAVQCIHHPGHHGPRQEQMDHRPPMAPEGLKPEMKPEMKPELREPHMAPHPMPGEHDVVSTIFLVLMLGMDIGVMLYFRQQKDLQRMADLEHENLEQQLEYLKYQINPHFLMNTLNNIHALVDIDPEQAKESIVELSKIMRFVLYEGSKQKVPLRQELSFLDNYLQLMRRRVTDKVRIDVSMPETIPDREIPPLILITFVENAFKHGITYQRPCFIELSVTISDNRLHFNCRNSKMPQGTVQQGGIGLANVKRRLELIYGSDYSLQLDDQAETFEVNLDIPL